MGSDNLTEYGPLIASLLLRLRLELCVIESYFFEAIVPFINQRGLSWVLPFHETVETFLTGSIFAVATNIILLTSTKIVALFFSALDIFTGMPTRFVGSIMARFTKSDKGDKSLDLSPVSIVSSLLRLYGGLVGSLQSGMQTADQFVGKYLTFATLAYIAFKYFHYKFL